MDRSRRRRGEAGRSPDAFGVFVGQVEARLRVALVASLGSVDGRAATVDALSWAWEHWERVGELANPVGYLYRVGRSAARRYGVRPVPTAGVSGIDDAPSLDVELLAAVRALPEQQRTVVMLVHAFGWSQRDVAGLLEVNPSTVHVHLERAVARLQEVLEVRDAG
jgi:DNA-directed RNA polymerase specialized sigma24 family protein